MAQSLQGLIDEANGFAALNLKGEFVLDLPKSECFYVGKNFSRNLVTITKPNLTLDFGNAVVRANIVDGVDSDINVFFVSSAAKNVEIKNLRLYVYLNCSTSARRVAGIYNTAYGLKLTDCRIEIVSERHIDLVGVYNNGNLDTHMETRADNLVIDNCTVKVQVNEGENEICATYGLYNYLANSISVQNTSIYSRNIGTGENQRAVGVYTNGRFGRFVGNNVKANASHNVGKLKEKAHAYGFINEGLYSIIASNNIVGEWGGLCVGLENRADFVKAGGNKILATHTIRGRSVRNFGNECVIDGNILTSTSRNARLLQQGGSYCAIADNVMEILLLPQDILSGCGIYAEASARENNIHDNILKNIRTCGIYEEGQAGVWRDNLHCGSGEFANYRERATPDDAAAAAELDENSIQSLYD